MKIENKFLPLSFVMNQLYLPMKRLLYLFIFTLFGNLQAQNPEVLSWINNNVIVIEDVNPDTSLAIFSANVPKQFENARIFGFGEATHRGKEFFDLKTKFFKYLVEKQGVKLFIMEESYQSERGINEWVSGGAGDKATIVNNFRQNIWYANEVKDLLQWMRDYNYGKTQQEQIRFYGMDNQFGEDLSKRLRNYVKKYNIAIDESLLAVADSCSAAKLKVGGIKDWDKKTLPELQQIKLILERDKENLITINAYEYYDMIRALEYLEQYTKFISAPYSHVRDNDMYENVLKILKLEQPTGKAFVWAHNEHINKKQYGSYNIKSLGAHLKNHFKEAYYAVGFDFGNGIVEGFKVKNGTVIGKTLYTLDKPYKNTFAATLFAANPDIYFLDMENAKSNPKAIKFFSSKLEQLFIGGPGFDPENKIMFKRRYSESYDGIIFVKTITPATYKKNN